MALRDRWAAIEAHRPPGSRAAPGGLAGTLRYRNLYGQELESPLWQMVQHVANHSTYHRGQVVTLLRQTGAKPVATD